MREAGAHGRVEALDRPQQAEVALLDQVLQAQALAGVAAGDVDHQAQVGADHAVAGLGVALADGDGQFLLVVGREQRGLVDLAEVGLQRRLDGGGDVSASCGLGHRGAYRQHGGGHSARLPTIDAACELSATKRRRDEVRANVAEFRAMPKKTAPPAWTGGVGCIEFERRSDDAKNAASADSSDASTGPARTLLRLRQSSVARPILASYSDSSDSAGAAGLNSGPDCCRRRRP